MALSLDPHQSVGFVRRLKAVLNRAKVQGQLHIHIAGVDDDGGDGQGSPLTGRAQSCLVLGVVLVMGMNAEIAVEGVFGVAQHLTGLCLG